MSKEILTFFCETTKNGIAGVKQESYSEGALSYAEKDFNLYSNCYLVKVRETDDDGMYRDTVLFKRNIEL